MKEKPTVIAAAQICARDEDVAYNLSLHYRMIRLAAESGVQLLVFPEMSITGYVRDAAGRLAFSLNDARLDELKNHASIHNMIIVAGAPVRLGCALHVGAFILSPDRSVSLYTKQYLYKNENDYFMPNCGNNPFLSLGQEKISLAICFDMENSPHIANAKEAGSTIYSASIFYSKASIDAAHTLLGTYAKTYALNVLMANFSGHLYHTPAGGQSAFWSESGEMLASLGEDQTGLVIGVKENGVWTGKTVLDEGVYSNCPVYKSDTVTLLLTKIEDAEELLKCYSDEKAVPFFNSDNCNGDNFHYTTIERMAQTIELWDYSYKTRNFVRWTVLMNETGEKIGTIEMFGRKANEEFRNYGILRIDLRSDYETEPILMQIFDIADKHFYDAFGVDIILTKAIPEATERIAALEHSGYTALRKKFLIYDDYYAR